MNKTALFAAVGIGVGLLATAAFAAPSATPSQAAASAKLTVNSTIGALIDNPKTDAVLKAEIPKARAMPMFSSKVGRDLTLTAFAQYDETLTPEKLRAIAAALEAAQN